MPSLDPITPSTPSGGKDRFAKDKDKKNPDESKPS